jgi:hypothetical protein
MQDQTVEVSGPEAIAAMCAASDAAREYNRRAVAQLNPLELARFEAWLRTRTSVQPPATSPAPRPAPGRAPREARTEHRRGSRRGERAASSSSDDPDPPSPQPCALDGCSFPRARGERHCSAEHRKQDARERKALQRERDRQKPERVAERGYQRALGQGEPHCRCSGEAAYEFDHGWWCLLCGRPYQHAYSEVNGHLADYETLEVLHEQLDEAFGGERRHEPWQLRRKPRKPPWPKRAYFDLTIVRDPVE